MAAKHVDASRADKVEHPATDVQLTDSASTQFTRVPVGDHSSEPETVDGESELDLCFMCDCTGSMSSYIHAAQQNIQHIAQRIMTDHNANVRFALITYRDHPPQDHSYVTRGFPFTESVAEMKGYVDTMHAQGGGDGPEAVTAAMSDALGLPWRPNAAKVAVLIADAPPHGLEPCGDGFPNGDPEGRDPLDIARAMAAKGVTCYSVGVEPTLSAFAFARDFMCTIAEITGGQAIALSNAAMLADVIIHGSAEEISMMPLRGAVEEEIRRVREAAEVVNESISDEVCAHRAWTGLSKRGLKTMQMQTDGAMVNQSPASWHAAAGTPPQSLAGAKAQLVAGSVHAAAPAYLPGAPARPRVPLATLWGAVDPCSGGECPGMVGSGHGMGEPLSGALPQQAATTNCLSTDFISLSQVTRIQGQQLSRTPLR
mmetsp:Transcript_15712/g.46602  ORF Transcript_15712/g.46602 Transcript_15712/m.46602 type:complete len:427 (-) Transcript_15712:210-1490(-)